METLVQFARQTLVVEILGEEGIAWFPFIATLFFFILYCNLLGLIPVFPGFTADLQHLCHGFPCDRGLHLHPCCWNRQTWNRKIF